MPKDLLKKFIGSAEASAKNRALGDQARDAGDWSAAVEHYSAHLAAHPNDFEIWVQKGNCSKELREFDIAIEAYRKAIARNPNDADVFLQQGHALKMSGARGEAIKSYKHALELDPELSAAAQELRALGVRSDSIAARHRPLHVDVTDLLFYLRAHMNVSGIQRVIASFVRTVHENRREQPYASISFVTVDWEYQKVNEIELADLFRVVEIVSSASKTRESLDRVINTCLSSNVSASFRKDDVYFIVGAFWVSPSYERIFFDLKEQGVSVGIYIYDLIPVMHRKFVTRDLAEGFTKCLYEMMPLCDFAYTISDFVADELRGFVKENFGRDLPISSVKLAHEIERAEEDESAIGKYILDLTRERYVLCVGTIETRKNHQYLVNIWRKLIDDGLNPPNLIMVGRWGWRVQDLKEQLEESDYLQGKVIVLDSISDPELAHLYQHCEFSAFPSFVEGWGLPVGESLAYGRPCIASNMSSIPEVGGDFVRYIDPNDLNMGFDVFKNAICDEASLKEWTRRIESEFEPVTWKAVTLELCSKLLEAARSDGERGPRAYYRAEQGIVAPIGSELRDLLSKRNSAIINAPLVRGSGWHPLESWGCWARSRSCSVRFGADLPDGARVTVGLKFRFPSPTRVVVNVSTNGEHVARLTDFGPKSNWRFVSTTVSNQLVELTFNCIGEVAVPPQEKRSLFLGIEAFSFAANESVENRFSMLQNIITFEGNY